MIIPAYNAEKWIGRAITSVLNQTIEPTEVIVVDDGSTDSTAQVVQKYGAPIRYFYYENAGLSTARNRGIERAKYEWIAWLDADDEWLPNFVASHIKLISRNPDVKWTYCRHEDVTQNGCRRWPIPKALEEEIKREGFLSYFRAEPAGFYFGTCGFMIRRGVFDALGDFDPAMRNGMDGDMWRRIALRYPRVAVCADVCWRYYCDTPNSLHGKGRGHRNVELKSVCRNFRRAMELGPEVVYEYRPYGKVLVMRYLMRWAARDCCIQSDTVEEAEHLFALTVRERSLLGVLRLLPKPIAAKVAGRLIPILYTRFRGILVTV